MPDLMLNMLKKINIKMLFHNNYPVFYNSVKMQELCRFAFGVKS